MTTHRFLRLFLILASSTLPIAASAVDVVKTWIGADGNQINLPANWNGGTRPTFGVAANTDALIFAGAGTGIVQVNAEVTAKSITVNGALGYTFQGANPVRLGDATTTSIQPNTGYFINNSTGTLALNPTAGIFFAFGKLEAAGGAITVGGNTPIDIGNGAATINRNLLITGGFNVTVASVLTGLGSQATAGGHLFKSGIGTLALNGSSTTWNGRIFLDEGVIRISRATSLGSTAGDTTIAGGSSEARLELTNSVTLNEPLFIAAKSSTTAPVVQNISGNNVINSTLFLGAGGTEYTLQSDLDTLTLTDVDYGTATGAANLRLQGMGRGVVTGVIGAGGDPITVIKEGAGTWALDGANAFTGSILVNAGRLDTTTAHAGGGTIAVASGATLGVKVAALGQSLNTPALTVVGTEGTTALSFDLSTLGNPSAPVLKSTALSVTGTVGVSLKASGLSIGQIPLIDYDGEIGGDGFAGLALVGLPARVSATLVNDTANTRVVLDVAGFDVPRWSGVIDSNWDVNDGTGIGTANWKEKISGAFTRYLQSPGSTDAVLFDDTATGSTDVVLTTDLAPVSITVDNSVLEYTFSGAGHISGAATLTKKGAGVLNLTNTVPNTFSGLTKIEAGAVRIGDGITAGAGSLGVGPVANEGTLILNRVGAYAVTSAISGAGSVVKLTAGVATLSGNSDLTGAVEIREGTVKLGNPNALGATVAGVTVSAGATLDVGGQLLPLGEVITASGAGVGDAGAIVNSGTAGAGVGLKNLILTGPTTLGGSTRWDIRESPGGVNVNGHTLTKAGTNTIFWANLGETHIGDLIITGAGSRLVFQGDTTLGDRPGTISVGPGSSIGFDESSAVNTKPIFIDNGTLNASGGRANVVSSPITFTTAITINTAAETEIVINGPFSGNASLTKTTGGILKVGSDFNYPGTTTNNAGPLWIGNDGPIGSLPPGDIVNHGNLTVRRTGAPLNLTQNISGTGQITIGNATAGEDGYQVTLSGNNTFTGPVTVARGTLTLTNSLALGSGTKVVAIQSNKQPTLRLDGTGGNIILPAEIGYNTSSDTGPAFLNAAGDNVIAGTINLRNGSGGNTRIRVDGGSLALTGLILAAPDATSARGLVLDGAGNGRVDNVLANGVGDPTATPPVLPQNLVLTKTGTGTWTLNGVNTYTGNTTISAGTLKLGVTGSIASSPFIDLTVGATFDVSEVPVFALADAQALRGSGAVLGAVVVGTGSTISPGSNTASGALSFSQLTLSGGTLITNLRARGLNGVPTDDHIASTGDLHITAPTVISLSATGAILNGSYRLIDYGGALVGDANNLTFINPTRYTLALDTTTPGQVNLVVGGSAASLVWSGDGVTNTWSATAPANIWNTGVDTFYHTDAVTFDDSAPGTNTTITVSGTVTPSSVSVNASQDFTFTGTGVINGVGGLTKSGTGTLTINHNTTYSGKTKISGGSLVLGVNGRLTSSRWIEVDQGAILDVQAVVAGLNLGGQADQRVLSGRGIINGNIIVSGGVLKPGETSDAADVLTAGDGIGALHFGHNLTLSGAAPVGLPRAILQIAGPTGSVEDPFNTPSVQAFASTAAAQHDQILVAGILHLDAGSTIRLELSPGYTPEYGDVFNLVDWATLDLNADTLEAGFDPFLAANLDLPVLPAGLYWNRSLFVSDGLVFISPEPPQVSAIEVTPGNTVNPGTVVTLSVTATGVETITYQWKRNLVDIDGAINSSLQLTAEEANEGSYTVVATNPAGHTSSLAVSFSINDPVKITQEPQSRTLNPGAAVTFSVTATGTGTLIYQWRKNEQIIEGAIEASYSLTNITELDQAAYDVVITNVVGSKTSAVAELQVNDAVSISGQPQALVLAVGSTATFSVSAAGTGPFTYQWRKGEANIEGATQATLVLENLTLDNADSYSVIVGNSVNSVPSESALLTVVGGTPKITALTSSKLVSLNTPLTLTVTAVAEGALKYQWFKNNVKIANAITSTYVLAAAQLKDAGAYRVEVTSAATEPSVVIEIGVVDDAERSVPLVLGGVAKLEVKAEGNRLSFAWTKDSEAVPTKGSITGLDKKILNIKPLAEDDSGLYKLVVTGPGGELTTQGHRLSVFSEKPIITEDPPQFGAAIVSGDFEYTIPVDPDPAKAPSVYAAAGLPPGLKLDTKTGKIAGKPTAISKDPLGYLVKLTASNSKDKSIVSGRLLVTELPKNAIGIFSAPIPRDAVLNAGLGGALELTTTATGTYSGKLLLGPLTYAFKGVLNAEPGSVKPESSVFIPRKGAESLKLTFTLDSPNNKLTPAKIELGEHSLSFGGWRNIWDAKAKPATDFAGYHTLGLDISEDDSTDKSIPQGNGFGSFTVTPAGKLTLSGKLADGETLSGSTFIGPEGQITVFRTLYATPTKGSIAGSLDIETPNLTGELTWSRPANSAKAHRLYKDGFSKVVDLTAFGGRYDAPSSGSVFLGLTAGTNNATLEILSGGIGAAGVNAAIEASIGLKSKAILPANPTTNPRKPTLTATEKTGLFKGAFALEDNNPLPVPALPRLIKRSVAYQGIAVRSGSGWTGVGYFLLPQLPSDEVSPATSPTTSPILSGQILLEPALAPVPNQD